MSNTFSNHTPQPIAGPGIITALSETNDNYNNDPFNGSPFNFNSMNVIGGFGSRNRFLVLLSPGIDPILGESEKLEPASVL